MNNFINSVKDVNNKLNFFLKNYYPDSFLKEAICYSALDKGKRIRALLTIIVGKIYKADYNALLIVASAIELIHCYSLIHDDLPGMDNAELRRGQLSNHKKYGEGIAILAGDALQSLAFELLSSDSLNISSEAKIKIIQEISKAIGINGMAGGQALDIINNKSNTFDNREEFIKNIHFMKTALLIKASILSGIYVSQINIKDEEKKLIENIAFNLGLLFQIIDDILDVTSTTADLGKTINIDKENAKVTYVSIYGIEKSKHMAHDLYIKIMELINKIDNFDNEKELSKLVENIYARICH